jgi:hypothetical protein
MVTLLGQKYQNVALQVVAILANVIVPFAIQRRPRGFKSGSVEVLKCRDAPQ